MSSLSAHFIYHFSSLSLRPSLPAVDSTKPLNLTALSEKMRAGNNAATVLRTELPMFKATPVSYLMNGPFGSFAPTYDSAFATLTKMDSDMLLHTYGSDIGVSYSHRSACLGLISHWTVCTCICISRWTVCTCICISRWTVCTCICISRWAVCTCICISRWAVCTCMHQPLGCVYVYMHQPLGCVYVYMHQPLGRVYVYASAAGPCVRVCISRWAVCTCMHQPLGRVYVYASAAGPCVRVCISHWAVCTRMHQPLGCVYAYASATGLCVRVYASATGLSV